MIRLDASNWRTGFSSNLPIGAKLNTDMQVDMYKDMSLSTKVIGAGGPVLLGPFAVCALPLVYPQIPVSVAYQMKEMHPEMSDMLAQIIGFVLEYITSTIAASVASFGVCVLVISTGLLNVVGKCMR